MLVQYCSLFWDILGAGIGFGFGLHITARLEKGIEEANVSVVFLHFFGASCLECGKMLNRCTTPIAPILYSGPMVDLVP